MLLAISANDKYHFRKEVKHLLKAKAKPFELQEARAIVAFTHRLGGVSFFLEVTSQEMVHVSCHSVWKFCHVLHMALREGHKQFYSATLQLQQCLCAIEQRWGAAAQAKDTFATCLMLYSRALLRKVEFQRNYEFFSGTLQAQITHEWDVNILFQLCCDMLDYGESLLLLQSAILVNAPCMQLDHATNIMPQLQLQLQPLITIASELATLHGHVVQVMCILYAQLSLDIVSELRNRFDVFHRAVMVFCVKVKHFNITIKLCDVPDLLARPANSDAQNVVYHDTAAPSAPWAPTAPAENEL